MVQGALSRLPAGPSSPQGQNLKGEKGGARGKGLVVPQSAQPMESPAENTAAIFYANDTLGPAPSMTLLTQMCSFHETENHKIKACDNDTFKIWGEERPRNEADNFPSLHHLTQSNPPGRDKKQETTFIARETCFRHPPGQISCLLFKN